MVDVVGGFPVAIKLVQTQDKFGIIICESAQSMEAVAEAVISMGHDIIVQRYVTPRRGQDIRAVVLGGKVIAAVRRQPTAGKLRRSLSTGARMSKVVLTTAQRTMALESARVVGLDLAAVDLLALKTGVSQVYDVHSSPGLREVEEAVHTDLAAPIVRYAAALALARRGSVRPAGRSGLRTARA
jgi:ribosomal protein S6--L-glutamate ligase